MNIYYQVVILDDNSELRKQIKQILIKSNFEVNIARSISHLLNLLSMKDFDACLLDVSLSDGGEEGLYVIPTIRNLYTDIYIEIQTGSISHKQWAYKLGADNFLLKPNCYFDGFPERIKEGIFRKKIAHFEKETKIDLQKKILQYPDDDINWCPMRPILTSFLTDCVISIEEYFESYSMANQLDAAEVSVLQQDLIEYVIRRILNY